MHSVDHDPLKVKGDGEMAQWLGLVVALLPEDLSLVPSTHRAPLPIMSAAGNPTCFWWGAHMRHTHAQIHTRRFKEK